MRAHPRQTRAAAGPTHDRPDRKRRQRPIRCPHGAKNPARDTNGPSVGQIFHDRRTDINRQRQPIDPIGLAMNGDFAATPIEVVEF
jgi:hypothetical protein